MVNYAIEAIQLVKRYPTTAKKELGRGWYWNTDSIHSFTGLISLIKRTKGPFIEALQGISFQVKKGEIFGILGPNGAGKTTLIKILCTLVLHDEGEVYVNGFNVQTEPNKVLQNLQAILPESRGFDWRLTGRQNLEFYALLYGLKEREAQERINYLLNYIGLRERADDMYQRYSTGMQRKLLLCRALMRDTPILLFDEPTVGLDVSSAADFRSLLLDKIAKEEGKTIFMSTHNLVEAQQMCDRVAIIDRGTIIACDTPDNIRNKMFDNRSFSITFHNAWFEEEEEKMVDELEKIPGIYAVNPEIVHDRMLQGLSICIDRNVDLSGILEIILKSGLKIRTINTQEPTLEEVFKAITGQRPKEQAHAEVTEEGFKRWR